MSSNKQPTKVFGITIGKKGATPATQAPQITKEEKAEFTYTPELPISNVIPNSVFEKYQVKGVLRKLAIAGLAIVVVLGGAFAGGQLLLANQRSNLDTINTELSDINAKSTQLTPYQAYQMAVDNKRTSLNNVVASDVNMGTIYKDILDSSGDHNVGLNDITVVQYDDPNAPGNACIDPDPFTTLNTAQNIIGCITLKGGTPSKDATLAFLHQLEAVGKTPGESYRNSFISSFSSPDNTSDNSQAHQFEGSVSFTDNLFTDQYSNLKTPLAEALKNSGTTKADKPAEEQPEPVKTVEPTTEPTEQPTPDKTTGTDGNNQAKGAGAFGQYALGLVPELTPNETSEIDKLGVTTCATGVFNDTTLEATLALIVGNHADKTQTSTISKQLADFVKNNCQAINTEGN